MQKTPPNPTSCLRVILDSTVEKIQGVDLGLGKSIVGWVIHVCEWCLAKISRFSASTCLWIPPLHCLRHLLSTLVNHLSWGKMWFYSTLWPTMQNEILIWKSSKIWRQIRNCFRVWNRAPGGSSGGKTSGKNLMRLSLLFEFAEFFDFKADPSVRPPPGDLFFIQARADLKNNCNSSG